MKFLLDSNVLLRWSDSEAPEHAVCTEAVSNLARQVQQAVTRSPLAKAMGHRITDQRHGILIFIDSPATAQYHDVESEGIAPCTN